MIHSSVLMDWVLFSNGCRGLDDAVCCIAGKGQVQAFLLPRVFCYGGVFLFYSFREQTSDSVIVFRFFLYPIVPPRLRKIRKYIDFSEQNDRLSHLFSFHVSPLGPPSIGILLPLQGVQKRFEEDGCVAATPHPGDTAEALPVYAVQSTKAAE